MLSIKLGEVLGSTQFLKKFVHYRYRELSLDCFVIESTVVNAEAP
jgi:hypothetical protein